MKLVRLRFGFGVLKVQKGISLFLELNLSVFYTDNFQEYLFAGFLAPPTCIATCRVIDRCSEHLSRFRHCPYSLKVLLVGVFFGVCVCVVVVVVEGVVWFGVLGFFWLWGCFFGFGLLWFWVLCWFFFFWCVVFFVCLLVCFVGFLVWFFLIFHRS